MTGTSLPLADQMKGTKSHTIGDLGYNTNVYAEKSDQMIKVGEYLDKSGFIPKELVQNEVSWFYG